MTPRLRFTPSRPMAPEFDFVSQKHVEPLLCLRRGAADYVQPLYQPIALPEPRPVVAQKAADPDVSAFMPTFEPRPCADCQEEFTPKAGNQVRCTPCGITHGRKSDRERAAAKRGRAA